MVTCTACATQQNSLIGSIPKIKFFHWLRQWHQYLSPYMISSNNILTTHTPYTYIHVIHFKFYVTTLKCTLFEIVYEEKKEPRNKSMPIFKELHDNSMSFLPFLSKTSPHTIHTVYFGMYLTSLKGINNNVIFLLQKCDTFARTTIGRTWLAEVVSQDHTHYT